MDIPLVWTTLFAFILLYFALMMHSSFRKTNPFLTVFFFSSYFSMSDNNSGGQRSAGDVLNDIGAMLENLTEELDSMLHVNPNQAGGGNNAGFSKA